MQGCPVAVAALLQISHPLLLMFAGNVNFDVQDTA
jgi:hypothetical protein